MTSYIAVTRAASGFLLGGVKVHRSSRFEAHSDACAFAAQSLRVNRDAGRDVEDSWVETSEQPYEVRASIGAIVH